MPVSSAHVTGSADEPLRLGARGRRGSAGARAGALLSGWRAIRGAIYGRLEETPFRAGVTILAGCLVAGAALATGAVLLGHSAAANRPPRAAGTAAAATPASPLASAHRPRSARPWTPAPQSQPQQHAAAGGPAQPATAAQPAAPSAVAQAAPARAAWCWSSGGFRQRGGDGTGWQCASSWRSWHRPAGDPWKR